MYKLALIVVDGWGITKNVHCNAFHAAKPRFMNWLLQTCPYTLLNTDGCHVGLLRGTVGNSEVGHIHLGSGRVVKQPLVLIEELWQQNEYKLNRNHIWQNMIKQLRQSGGTCHMIGLISTGEVHGSYRHLLRWSHILYKRGIKYNIHAITDGRDSSCNYALNALSHSSISEHIKTIAGRFYAMDRDRNWKRSLPVAEKILNGNKVSRQTYTDLHKYLQEQYRQNNYDEFIVPAVHQEYQGIKPEDLIFILHFRHDRIKQLLQSLMGDKINIINDGFSDFVNCSQVNSYSDNVSGVKLIHHCQKQQIFSVVQDRHLMWQKNVLLNIAKVENALGEVLSKAGLSQLRVTESEKSPHVTWFLNGGYAAWPGEDHLIIPSVKCRAWSDFPQMSAVHITQAIMDTKGNYDFIFVNYANCDLVGHSGDFDATIIAVQIVDRQLELLCNHLLQSGYKIIITADHGNAEQMFDSSWQKLYTGHTNNPVPCIFLGWNENIKLNLGSLIDVAPTVLRCYNLTIPKNMHGVILFS